MIRILIRVIRRQKIRVRLVTLAIQ